MLKGSVKAVAAVMGLLWRRYKLHKIDQVLNMLCELNDWETSVIYISRSQKQYRSGVWFYDGDWDNDMIRYEDDGCEWRWRLWMLITTLVPMTLYLERQLLEPAILKYITTTLIHQEMWKKISCYMQNILLIGTLGQMITLNEKRKT